MGLKKIPLRTCVQTREKFPKQELIRVVRTPGGIYEREKNTTKNMCSY